MRFIFILFFATAYFQPAFATVDLSKEIYSQVPFSSQFIEDGALIRNINYQAVKALIPQLNKKYKVKLRDRGEAHVTVITPPEAQGWFTPDHKGINYLISSVELHQKYFKSLQQTKFKILCVGKLEQGKKKVFYLVVDSPELFKVRKEIQKELKKRSRFTGKKTHFKAGEYYPHITIGFVGGDIHGVAKDRSTCVESISFI